jgi:hypothetical protein
MKNSIGIDSMVLVRDARKATRRALFFSSSVAETMPRIFFWFGQISTHTLNSMMVPSQAPMPIGPMPLRSRKASTKYGPSKAAPAIQVTTAAQRKNSRARGATCLVMPAAVPSAPAFFSAATCTKLK